MEEDGASDLSASCPLSAVNVLKSNINTRAEIHVLYASYIN